MKKKSVEIYEKISKIKSGITSINITLQTNDRYAKKICERQQ